jgi:hypothetical protein
LFLAAWYFRRQVEIMLSFSSRSSFSLALSLVAVIIIGLAPYKGSARSSASSSSPAGQDLLTAQPAIHAIDSPRAFVLEEIGGAASCRDASPEEALTVSHRDYNETLHVITPARGLRTQATGLQITLRATQQLEGFPDAKAAYLRAAATWEAIIQTPVSIVIDVDFGPTRFGTPFPPNVLGSTDPQIVSGSTVYPSLRSALINSAVNAQETSLYGSLPATTVPTDLGSTSEIHCPTATFRVLGLLNAVADPTGEQSQLGNPPSTGFNSAFQFDFSPSSNPIDPNKFDFNVVATHEIGHALGFTSEIGVEELRPSSPLAVSVWDLYRFRPGVGPSAFTTGQRIESSGGTQVYYAGGPELGLATGRIDGSGGDGRQGSHWKSVAQTGTLVGIMDPAVPPGVRRSLSNNDLAAIHSFGYSVTAGGSGGPPGPTGGTTALTSGVGTGGSVPAGSPPSCFVGSTQYTIQVPSGTTQLTVSLAGNQSDALLMRFGQAVVVSGGQATADFLAEASGTNQSISVNGASSPALQAGTYFIAVANCSTSAMNFTITATTGASSGGGTPPALAGLKADLIGNTLTLTGTATDTQNALTQADVAIMDSTGKIVGDTSPFVFAFGASPSSFAISLTHMENYPSGVTASLIVIDSGGAHSSAVTAGFGNADPGGPDINSISFDDVGGLMLIKGGGFTGQLQLEINGVIVAPPAKIKMKGGGSKLKIPASGATLNLHNGMNRVRMMNNGERSGIVVLTL